jgi:hypothetical protein
VLRLGTLSDLFDPLAFAGVSETSGIIIGLFRVALVTVICV